MNRLLFVFAMVFAIISILSVRIQAQIFPVDKGSINAGGDIRVSSSGGSLYEYNNNRLTTIEAKPYAGYFFFKQLSIGGKMLLLRSSQDNYSKTAWGLGPNVKYFFGDAAPKRVTQGTIYLFLEAGIFLSQNITERGSESTVYSGGLLETGCGMCYMMTNSVGFVSGISLQLERMSSSGKVYYGNTVNFTCGFTAFLYNYY